MRRSSTPTHTALLPAADAPRIRRYSKQPAKEKLMAVDAVILVTRYTDGQTEARDDARA
jgi:hypothetical protein